MAFTSSLQEDDKIGCVVFGAEDWTPTCFKVCAIDNEENEYYIGIKGLFHSFRIPMFDIQIATEGGIKTHIENTGHLTHLVQRAIMKVRNRELFPFNKETEMKTIFNTIILALLAIFVAACGDTPNVNVDPDSGVPDGTVDECESVVSCDDPLADECGLECPDPVSFCNLGDPNRFIPNGCGFNNRGELEQRCVFSLEYEDYIWDDVECVDPDECVIDEVDERSCGINDIGSEYRICENGHWAEFGSCKFAEYLTHDDFYADAGAVFYNEGDSWHLSEVSLGEEFTVSMWVNLNDGISGRILNIWGNTGAMDVSCNIDYCRIDYTGRPHATILSFSNVEYLSGSFHHIAITSSATNGIVVYLDGAEALSVENVFTGDFSNATVVTDPNFPYGIAEVKHLSFFDGVLIADEILDLYNYGH